jgi:cob(I)alamin adenosyltransferase
MKRKQERTGSKWMIHVYCGEGKGKSTAAVGLILRFIGRGRCAMLVQFLKNGHSGELAVLSSLPSVRVMTGLPSTLFSNIMNEADREAAVKLHAAQLAEAVKAARNGEIDLLVLDEAFGAIRAGLLPEQAVLDFLRSKPSSLEVVLTGRDPSKAVLDLADYISDITCVRHPFQRGVSAREGIEY